MELIRALGMMAEPPMAEHKPVADALGLGAPPEGPAYTELFLFQLYPYASIYLGADGMMGGDAADRIAGFWTALGHTPPAEPDHLAALLSLLAGLCDAVDAEPEEATRLLLTHARDTCLVDHLLSWLPSYLHAVQRNAVPFYRDWAELLALTLGDLSQSVVLDTVSTDHLERIPALTDPRDTGGQAFLTGLLAPARSGFVVARADLARTARDLGLGLRIGERSYQLKALLSQDPQAVLGWLESDLDGWAAWHQGESWAPGPYRNHWLSRSQHSRDLLAALVADGWDEQGAVSESVGVEQVVQKASSP